MIKLKGDLLAVGTRLNIRIIDYKKNKIKKHLDIRHVFFKKLSLTQLICNTYNDFRIMVFDYLEFGYKKDTLNYLLRR